MTVDKMKSCLKCKKDAFGKHFKEQSVSSALALLTGNIVVVFISYSLFLRTRFSQDTYGLTAGTTTQLAKTLTASGRFFGGLAVSAINMLGIHVLWNQQFGTLVLMISLSICVTLLVQRMKTALANLTTSNLVILNGVVQLSFVNIFLADMFQNPEVAFVFSSGFLLSVGAVFILSKTWSLGRIIISFLLVTLSICTYQIFFEIFIIYSLCILLIQNDFSFNKTALLNTLKVLVIGIVSTITSLMLSSFVRKIFDIIPTGEKIAVFNFESIITKVKDIIIYHGFLLSRVDRLIPANFAMLLIGGVIFSVIYIIIKIMRNRQTRIRDYVFIAVIIFGCYAVVFSTHIVSPVLWLAPRTMIALFSWLSLVIITVFLLSNKKAARILVAVLSGVILLVNIFVIQQIAADQLINNALDRQWAEEVVREIKSYETATGNTINRIALSRDLSPIWSHPEVKTTHFDTNIRAGAVPYAVTGLFYYVSGRQFERVSMDEKIFELYYQGKDWNEFIPKEQMHFVGDTLYMVMY